MAISKITSAGVDPNSVVTNGASGAIDVNASAPADSVAIDSSGRVGIGTSSPTSRLHVLQSADTTAGGLQIRNAADSNSIYIYQDGTTTTYDAGSSGAQAWKTGSAERMRIDGSGNLLVGTTSTQRGKVTINQSATSGYSNALGLLANNDGGTFNMVGFYRYDTLANVGSISSNGTSTSFNTSSDYRLKENIAPMTGALVTVQQLNPVTYNWKVDGSSGQGFIAHELQAVVPDCVTGEKDAVDADGNPVYQGIDTSFLVATLTAAIKEQQAIIESLTARIEVLEAK